MTDAETTEQLDTWFRCFNPAVRPGSAPGSWRPEPGLRLVCFPHGGGTAGFYRPWARALPPDVQLLAVSYPGRLDRMREPFATDLHELAERITNSLTAVLHQPMAFFGHSMGATVAYEVARRIEQRTEGVLTQLIVSGQPAPSMVRHTAKHLLNDAALWDEACRLGGIPDKLAGSPEMRKLAVPSLRSDYRLNETYWPCPAPPLTCPVLALAGDNDSEASVEEVRAWETVAGGEFALRVFPGGHFYLIPEQAELLRELVAWLARHHPFPGRSASSG